MTQHPTACTSLESLQCGGSQSPAGPQPGEGQLNISDVNSGNTSMEQALCLGPALHRGMEEDKGEGALVFFQELCGLGELSTETEKRHLL